MAHPSSSPCPCHSQLTYGSCCAPLHDRASVAPSATTLMRSRFSAYALHLPRYLQSTLDPSHPDAALSPRHFARAIAEAVRGMRYAGLSIHHEQSTPYSEYAAAEVLFVATLYAGDEDTSFGELSFFTRGPAGYAYKDGILVPRSRLPADPSGLTRANFLARAGR